VTFASQAQCEQRRGRTGRTCAGTVYRLIPAAAYRTALEKYEPPAVQLQSLHRTALSLACGESKRMRSPWFVRRCMDPPPDQHVEDAVVHLVAIGALTVTAVGLPASGTQGKKVDQKVEPTELGRMLSSFKMNVPEAAAVVRGGAAGLLHEACLLAAINSTMPACVPQIFGDRGRYAANLARWWPASSGVSVSPGDRPAVLLANMAAYEGWQRLYRDVWRARRLACHLRRPERAPPAVRDIQLAGERGPGGGGGAGAGVGARGRAGGWVCTEEGWCAAHGVSHIALLAVEEAHYSVLGILHEYRPLFVGAANERLGPPPWVTHEVVHDQCECPPWDAHRGRNREGARVVILGPSPALGEECRALVEGLAPPHLLQGGRLEACRALLEEIGRGCGGMSGVASGDSGGDGGGGGGGGGGVGGALTSEPTAATGNAPVCVHFIKGRCDRGSDCRFRHETGGGASSSAGAGGDVVLPPCRFFGTREGYRFGDRCHFRHGAVGVAGDTAPPRLSQLSGALSDWATRGGAMPSDWTDQPPTATTTTTVPSAARGHLEDLPQLLLRGAGAGAVTAPPSTSAENPFLLVGDSDFSFALALSRRAEPGAVVASTLEPKARVRSCFPRAARNVDELTARGGPAAVSFGVDATRLLAGGG
jgi:hypothetical protein